MQKHTITPFAIAPLGITACFYFQRFYVVREMLIFLVFAALLVLFGATLFLLGILFQEAGQSIFRALREAKRIQRTTPETPNLQL